MNIYITNLSSAIGNKELAHLFSSFGEVKSAEVIKDIFTRQSRGFGYVEMEDDTAAQNAIAALNKTEVQELVISVEESKPQNKQIGSYEVSNRSVKGYTFREN